MRAHSDENLKTSFRLMINVVIKGEKKKGRLNNNESSSYKRYTEL